MPIYEFKCDCGNERELVRPFSRSGEKPVCACGQVMERKFSPVNFVMVQTGRDGVLSTLNQDTQNFPGGNKHKTRYKEAYAKGLDLTRPVIGRGF